MKPRGTVRLAESGLDLRGSRGRSYSRQILLVEIISEDRKQSIPRHFTKHEIDGRISGSIVFCSFDVAMKELENYDLLEILKYLATSKKIPFLGICLAASSTDQIHMNVVEFCVFSLVVQ